MGLVQNASLIRKIHSLVYNISYNLTQKLILQLIKFSVISFRMFSSTFWMLSQSFCTSLIFTESFCTFRFKVCIKQNRIWDTLPTSKTELLVTIGISKAMFCRLMILRIQFCPMSVLWFVPVRYWFYHVPGGSTCEYLRLCSFRQKLLLILYLFGKWYCGHSFLPMNFLFFWVSLLLVPSWYSWLHLLPECSGLFHAVPACSRWFQLLHCFSMCRAHHVLKMSFFPN